MRGGSGRGWRGKQKRLKWACACTGGDWMAVMCRHLGNHRDAVERVDWYVQAVVNDYLVQAYREDGGW